jgi:hypothetical protein
VQQRWLFIATHVLLIGLAVWLSFRLRLVNPFSAHFLRSLWMLPTALLIGLALYAITGQYKGLTRFVVSKAFIAPPGFMSCWSCCWLSSACCCSFRFLFAAVG